jgi:HD-GYP domain-containing protein (c-di-GMP phosphodiesterase class II)
MGMILRLSEIPIDKPLSESLYDGDGVMVMPRGTVVSADMVQGFSRRGLKFLELGEPDHDPFASSADPDSHGDTPLDIRVSIEAELREDDPLPPNAVAVLDPPSSFRIAGLNCDSSSIQPYHPETSQRIDHLAKRATEVVSELGTALAEGTLRDAGPIHDVAESYLRELKGDVDQVVAETLAKPGDRDLALRSVQMSVLSMAICRAMKLPESDWGVAGAAAMLHDMALFRLPQPERFPHPLMKPESRQVYEWHPAIAYDMLEKVRDTDGTVRLIVLQTHEQADGSGFPRRITLPRIHRLARVLNVADTYLRLVGCGCDGQKIFPADAMAYLMHHSCMGRFDAEVTCGLVKVVSLYPIGSLVTLTNARTARVLRCNPDSPMQPVVLLEGENEPVDLSKSDLDVSEPEDDPSSGRRRLPSGEFDRILW